MDALFVMTSATWMVCELVRVFGGYAMREAQEIVDALSVKEYPVILERAGRAIHYPSRPQSQGRSARLIDEERERDSRVFA